MAKKNNIRSIRFSDDVLEIIEAQEGDTFTAKFESLIRTCYQELPAKEQELKKVQESIAWHRNNLRHIMETKRNLEIEMNRMERLMSTAGIEMTRCIELLEKIES